MLTSKQRAFLRGMANGMDAIFQVGKNGVTPELRDTVYNALEARELVKISVLDNNMLGAREAAEMLASRTGAEVVQVIGNKFVLYRAAKKPVIELPAGQRNKNPKPTAGKEGTEMRNEIANFRDCKSIAIMGGTFDPIHHGHLVTAEAVRYRFKVDKVVFMPAGQPAHKTNKKVTHNEHRYLMTVLATMRNENFEVSRIEIDRAGVTYTIDTIEELKRMCRPDVRLYFITGADAIHQIMTWKESERLLGMCDFVAVTRPGYDKSKLFQDIGEIQGEIFQSGALYGGACTGNFIF